MTLNKTTELTGTKIFGTSPRYQSSALPIGTPRDLVPVPLGTGTSRGVRWGGGTGTADPAIKKSSTFAPLTDGGSVSGTSDLNEVNGDTEQDHCTDWYLDWVPVDSTGTGLCFCLDCLGSPTDFPGLGPDPLASVNDRCHLRAPRAGFGDLRSADRSLGLSGPPARAQAAPSRPSGDRR